MIGLLQHPDEDAYLLGRLGSALDHYRGLRQANLEVDSKHRPPHLDSGISLVQNVEESSESPHGSSTLALMKSIDVVCYKN